MAKTFLYKRTAQKKKGLSAVVTTLLLIMLGISIVAIVWVSVTNMIKHQISSSQSCYGNYNKVVLNYDYTCFNEINPTNYSLRFSLSIGDISADSVIVSVSDSSGVIKSYTITNTPGSVSGLAMYPSGSTDVVLPGKNSGLSYTATDFPSKIDSVTIKPSIGGNLCDVSDSLSQIDDCSLIS